MGIRAWVKGNRLNGRCFHTVKLVDERAGVSLEVRPTNKRRRMAEEGTSKSARDKLNKVDVIAGDKKLIEIYTAIVKEMAVKYVDAESVA